MDITIPSAMGIKIGYHNGSNKYMNAHLRGLRVYNTVKTSDEIRKFYERER